MIVRAVKLHLNNEMNKLNILVLLWECFFYG
nr:MAG TPA: hypothetical protein [Caudoviricetes sp.]